MPKKYPSDVDVVEGADADFVIRYLSASQEEAIIRTLSELRDRTNNAVLSREDLKPIGDMLQRPVFADVNCDVAAWESYLDRHAKNVVTNRVRLANAPQEYGAPLVVLADIGWPQGYKPAQGASTGAIGFGGLALLASDKEIKFTRRNSLYLLAGASALAVLALTNLASGENGDIYHGVDVRSAWLAQRYVEMSRILRQESPERDRRQVWGIEIGSLHRDGERKGYGFPQLLGDRDKRVAAFVEFRGIIQDALDAPVVSAPNVPQEIARSFTWPWVYRPDATGSYNTKNKYKPKGDLIGETDFEKLVQS